MARYELIESDRPGLFRLRALMNFSDVAVGDVGGYVDGEHNLSQNDTAWVYDHAVVRGQAVVYDRAVVRDHAVVWDHAVVRGRAEVCDQALVCGQAVVTETTDLLVVGPIGTRNAYMTICIPAGTVTTGCFHGSVDEFEAAVAANPTGREDYIAIIPAIRVIIANRTREGADQ